MMAQFASMVEELSSLKVQIDEIRKKSEISETLKLPVSSEVSFTSEITETSEFPEKLYGLRGLIVLTVILLMTCGALILLHWVLLFVYDINLLALRIATVILPLMVGTVIYRKISVHWAFNLIAAVLLGLAAVFGMLGVTSYIDDVSFVPENIREWREVAEYAFAIACAFFTGLLIENWRVAHQINLKRSINLRLLVEKDEAGRFKAAEWTNQVQSLFTAVAPFISAGTAIVSGVRVFTG